MIPFVVCLAVSGTNLFAGSSGGGIFRSTNSGATWFPVTSGLTSPFINAFAVKGTDVFAGTDSGVFRTTNSGTHWTAVNSGLTNLNIYSLAMSGTILLAGTDGGVFLSTNNGTNWGAFISGLTDSTILSLAISGLYLFAGTTGDVVWRRPLSEMITSVEELSTDLPTQVSLEQNYPNPFNPSTTISYEIRNTARVSLNVYDILGREVARLVDAFQNPGSYRATFDASRIASGVYFYRLVADNFTLTHKMLLLK